MKPLRILLTGWAIVFAGCNSGENARPAALDGDRFGGGCTTVNIRILSGNKSPLVQFKLPDFCAVPTSRTLSEIVAKIRLELIDENAVRLKIECGGIRGANQFVLMDSNIVGYRKLCDTATGNTCRHEYKVDDVWHKESELFSQACAKKLK